MFLHFQVKAEVRKLFDRLREKEAGHNTQHSLLTQSLTYLSKGRASVQSLHTVSGKVAFQSSYVPLLITGTKSRVRYLKVNL